MFCPGSVKKGFLHNGTQYCSPRSGLLLNTKGRECSSEILHLRVLVPLRGKMTDENSRPFVSSKRQERG